MGNEGRHMSRKQLQELIRNLQEFYACPSCETPYKSQDIKVLGQVDNYCFVQLGCKECAMPVLATVAASQEFEGIAANRLQRDVKAKEARRFARKGAITALEIADFHNFISGYSGRLTNLQYKKVKG
jgi:hypothetical protein